MKNINQSKGTNVTKVFDDVFSKYDLMNDIMSFGAHRIWKNKLIDWMNPGKNDHAIDIASGTGDIAKAILRRTNFTGIVKCIEPNKNMLKIGKKKLEKFKNVKWFCSSAEKYLKI